jgi:peptidylprolyl isomerase
MNRRTLIASGAVLGLATRPGFAQPVDPENTLYLDLTYGRVVIQLLPDVAPSMSRKSRHWRARAFMTERRSTG